MGAHAVQVGHSHPCYMYHQMCEGQATLKEVLEQRGDHQGAEVAFEAGKRCMVALSQLDGCHEYVALVLQQELELSQQQEEQLQSYISSQ
jgi:hypothetical protein